MSNSNISLNTQPDSIVHADLKYIQTHDGFGNTKESQESDNLVESVIRPQRKLADSAEDRILSGLCLKTKAISIEERTVVYKLHNETLRLT